MEPASPPSPFRRFIPVELASPEGWKSGVTIYAKALAIFALAVLLLFGALFGLTESVILSQFSNIERVQVESELDRLEELVRLELEQLGSTAGDWSNWDDLYHYMQNPDPGFLAKNLNPVSVENLRLNFLSLWNLDGKCLAIATPSRTTAPAVKDPLARDVLDSGFLEKLQEPGMHTGLILSGNRVLVVAGARVLDSRRTRQSSGYLVIGRFLGEFPLPPLRSGTGSSVKTETLASLLEQDSLRDETIAMLATGNKQVLAIDGETVVGMLLLQDFSGRPVAVLVLRQKRELFQAGIRTGRIFLLTMTAAGGGLVLVLWFVIDWNLLRRISRIDLGVRTLAATGRFPEDAQLRSHDELGRLSRSIIAMSNSLKDAEQNYRRLFESSHDGTVVLSLPGLTILEANPAFSSFVDTPVGDLLGRRLDAAIPVFPTEDLLANVEAGALFHRTELILRGGGEKPLCAEVVGKCFLAPTGPRLQVSFRDVTDRREAAEKLRELSGRLLSLQDEERRRIARELHDSTAQNLSALEMNLVLLEKQLPPGAAKARTILADSRNIAESSSREIRTLSYLLHPPLLDEVGLLFAIRWFVEGYVTRTGVVIDLNLPKELPRFPPEVETTLFRIVQEALTNIHRHAESESGWIFLSCDNREITLQIGDGGKGFSLPLSPAGAGLGLAGMKERVRQHDGEFLIESSKRGTVLSIRIPLPKVQYHAENPN